MRSISSVLRAYSLRMLFCTCALLLVVNQGYGDLIGTNYDYSGISEYFTNLSGSPDSVHTYGTPEVNVNTLIFKGPKFSSTTSGLNTSDMLDGRLEVRISAHDGYGLDAIKLYENGGYHYFGPFGGPQTTSEVNLVTPQLQITKIEGDPVELVPMIVGNMVFSPSNLFRKTIDPLSGQWEGSLNISVADLLANTQYAGKLVTEAVLRFDNVLYTSSDAAGAYAYIDKKTIQITSCGIPVPEPGTLVALCMGLMGLGLWLRKN